MKKNLLVLFTLILTGFSFSQVVFSVETPASITGSYELTYVSPPDWGSPDLLDPLNAVQDTLAFAEDATASDSLNCGTTISNIAGKVAVVYRGTCEFGTKALNAQNAGAVAVVIINNQSGALIQMAAGADGALVTIPVVMINDIDGALVTTAMNNGDVEIFIGNKNGFYSKDLGLLSRSVLKAPRHATPSLIAQDDNDFQVELGSWVYNFGTSDQTNVTLNATVTLGGTEIYNETSSAQGLVSGDSAYISLPTFSQPAYTVGNYETIYTVDSDSLDDYSDDNSFDASFKITEDLLSFCRLDNNTFETFRSGGTRPVDATNDYTTCLTVVHPNASRMGIEGVNFSAITGTNSNVALDEINFSFDVWKWNDMFTDLDDPNFGLADYEYVGGKQDIFVMGDFQDSALYVAIDEPIVLLDNQRYLVCMGGDNLELFMSYDRGIDYTQNELNYNQPLFPIFIDNATNPIGFGPDNVPALSVKVFAAEELGIEENAENINITAFPNPVVDNLKISLNNNAAAEFAMYDLSGKVVKSGDIFGYANLSVNVKDVDNGAYIVKIGLEDGRIKVLNVVVNH